MISLEHYRNPQFVTHCLHALEEIIQETPGIKSIMLATVDGFEVASKEQGVAHSGDKLAAVGSSLFSLSASLVNEFALEDCKSINIDSEKGRVFISAIRVDKKQLILMIQSNQNAMLARILHAASKLSEHIAQHLERL